MSMADRVFKIIKNEVYKSDFTQVDTASLGAAAGMLTPAGFKLYAYLIGNKNNYNFTLSPLAYARWQGEDYVDENGKVTNENLRSKINKSIRDGLKSLEDNGLVNKITDTYFEFLEQKVPCETKSSTENEISLVEQKVPQETKSSTFFDF